MRPPVKKLLQVARPELVTERLQPSGIGAREKAVVETCERDARPAQLLFHPFMPVETQLDRIRDIGPDLDERGAPLRVLRIEVIVIDGDRLSREIERHTSVRSGAFVGFERARFFLGDADDHHAVLTVEARPMSRDDRVFCLGPTRTR